MDEKRSKDVDGKEGRGEGRWTWRRVAELRRDEQELTEARREGERGKGRREGGVRRLDLHCKEESEACRGGGHRRAEP